MASEHPMKLYSSRISTFSRRVRIALIEKGLAVDEVETAPDARATLEYRAINPYGRVPALVDGDVVLYESTAILEYIEALHPDPPLVPADPAERARVAMHVKLCDLEFTPHAVAIQRPKRQRPEETWDRTGMAVASAAIERHYAILDRELEGREYLAAERFTWADLAYLPFLHFHALLEVALPPNIAAWWEHLRTRDSALATAPSR
jgi:glutathione S-transferase